MQAPCKAPAPLQLLGYLSSVRRIGVLASGSGTILGAMLDDGLPIAVVVVDRPCGAVEVAEKGGVPVEIIPRVTFGPDFDRVAYTHEVVDALARHDVDVVAMAGFGTILEKPIHDAYPDRIVNTHPALLPAFKGWHAVEDALAAGVKVTGCTVHIARLEVDDGPILAQEAVSVLDDDTVETLHERIKEVERRLYPQVLRSMAQETQRSRARTSGTEERSRPDGWDKS
jgi:phosphoribosylglycinamide formyltransferase-1